MTDCLLEIRWNPAVEQPGTKPPVLSPSETEASFQTVHVRHVTPVRTICASTRLNQRTPPRTVYSKDSSNQSRVVQGDRGHQRKAADTSDRSCRQLSHGKHPVTCQVKYTRRSQPAQFLWFKYQPRRGLFGAPRELRARPNKLHTHVAARRRWRRTTHLHTTHKENHRTQTQNSRFESDYNGKKTRGFT